MALIVVADDDADIRELVEFKLPTLGHDIVTVGDGGAAVDACRTEHPDLAVLDIMMPGAPRSRGGQADPCQPRRRRDPGHPAHGTRPAVRCPDRLRLGADDYITKPFSPKDLAARVEALLRSRRLRPRVGTSEHVAAHRV